MAQETTETQTDLDDNLSQVNRDHTVGTTDISGDVDTQERIRSGGVTFDVATQHQIIAEAEQRLTLQAQMNSNFANLQATIVAAMAQGVQNTTQTALMAHNQVQRCVDHSEEAQHKTMQAAVVKVADDNHDA